MTARPRRRRGSTPTIASLTKVTEESIQVEIVARLKLSGYENQFFHVPNGEKRSPATGAKLKRMGVSPGVSDLFLGPARPGRPPAVLELKRPGEKPTAEQYAWLKRFEAWGFLVGWADTIDKAIAQLTEWGYLGRHPPPERALP